MSFSKIHTLLLPRHDFHVNVIQRLRSCYCPKKPKTAIPKSVKVALLGARGKTGQAVALMLKSNSSIEQLRLFDWNVGVDGIAADLMHIDSRALVLPYMGLSKLRQCVSGCHVVVVLGGYPEIPCMSAKELFDRNAELVRETAAYAAEFNPKGLFCISTPPVDAMVALAFEVYKKEQVYDPRKIIGITSVWRGRVNSVTGRCLKKDPSTLSIPIAGGTEPRSFVPVLSVSPEAKNFSGEDLLNDIYNAENNVLCVKQEEKSGPVSLSPAYPIAKFVNCIVRQLKGEQQKSQRFAFVKQFNSASGLKFATSAYTADIHGVSSTAFPTLGADEALLWDELREEVAWHTTWGQSYLNGERPKSFKCVKPQEVIVVEVESEMRALQGKRKQ